MTAGETVAPTIGDPVMETEVSSATGVRRPLCRRAAIASAVVVTIVIVTAAIAASRVQDRAATKASAVRRESTVDPLPVAIVRVGSFGGPELSSNYAGLLIARRDSVLGFERGGRVARVVVDEASDVHAGDLIAELDQQDLDAAEKRVRSELVAAEALLAERIAGPRDETIQAARARVKELSARVDLAKLEAERQQQLASRGATSRSELDAAVFGLQASENGLLAAQAALEELSAGTRKEQIAAQRAECDAIEAELEQIESQRQDSRIVAPFDGTVAQRMIDEGVVVPAGAAVVQLVSDRREAQVGLPPRVAADLKRGDPVVLQVRQSTRCGVIDRIEPTVRRETRTRVVFARVVDGEPNEVADSEWVVGEVVQMRVPTDSKRDANAKHWLPAAALVRGAKGLWAVLVLPGEDPVTKCQRRAVEVLKTDGSRVLVQGMLKPGERVIAEGVHRLTAGMVVREIESHPSNPRKS